MRLFLNAWFVRFANKQGIGERSLWEAVDRAERGVIDADLGAGLLKQRVARPGAGKSKGFRTLLFYRNGDKAFFVFGFAKSEADNVRPDEEERFKRAAKITLAFSDEQIALLVNHGQLVEIFRDAKEISK